MPSLIPTLIVQSASAVFNPCKDFFLYINGKKHDIEDLEDNLKKLLVEVIAIQSRKNNIDRILEGSVSKEKNDEYKIVEKQIEVIHKKFTKFITKYQKVTTDLQSAVPERDALRELPVLDASEELPDQDTLKARKMIDELQKRKPKILTRNFFKLAQLSRDIVKLTKDAREVRDSVRPENLIVGKKLEVVQVQHADNDLPLHSRYVADLVRYLSDQNVKRIGITGPVGVGKTIVLRKLNNQLENTTSLSDGNNSFRLDIVIWITFPRELGRKEMIVERIQDEIMERLKLNQESCNSVNQKAFIISTFLREKRYIVLMDQVSSYIDLNDVGLKEEDHLYGKVVIASSNKKLIHRMMDQVVEIKKLSGSEAKTLFENIYGKIEADHNIIAGRIIECCGGLPLLITLVAKYLKDTKSSWYDVKRILQSDTESDDLLSLGGVGNAYKMVYEDLKPNYMKKCLLYGALFPSEHKIHKDYLVECWMAERFIDINDTRRLRATRDRGVTVLKELTDKYLLEWCSDNYVKMPLYCRKVALKQKCPDDENCVIWVPWDNELLSEEIWMKATRMSLICCNSELPEIPGSSNLSTLLLQRNPELVTIGALFFHHMRNLLVLDLHKTGIITLPKSISSLVNLISLYLNNCSQLAKLPAEVKGLKKLELLDIRGTSIPSLPDEVGEMVCLRCLRLSFAQIQCECNSKRNEGCLMIPLNIICRLQHLEEFTVETGCCNQGWSNIADQVVNELASLNKLTTLSFRFPSVHSLKKFVNDSKSWKDKNTHWENNTLRSFRISIGFSETKHPYSLDFPGSLDERQLRFLTGGETSSVKEVLKQASAFELVGHSSVESLSEFDLETTGALKVCVVECCNKLLNIVDSDKTDEMRLDIREETVGNVLQCLEKLHLFDLLSLQSIWKGLVFPGSLSKLKVLTLFGCPELTDIFNHELAKALSSLEHLYVENCSKIVDIVKVEISDTQEQADMSDILHKVEMVELVNLPELQSICRSTSLNWKSLRKSVIQGCSKLTNLSLTLSNAEKLETIQCEASWWTTIQLSDEEKQHFGRLLCFIIMEPPPAVGAYSQGESSSSVRSDNPQNSNNIDSQTYNGDNMPKEVITSSSGSSNAFATSDIIALDGAVWPVVQAKISEDFVTSKTVAHAKTSAEDSEVESATCQLSCSEEQLCKNGSVKIHSSEMYSLTNAS
ncbi:putative disease resistance protein [Sesamum alatum]|uniref:Disease resistance protein n=1 Tax=Sesamum alatum TaxID=300844 RepID=A0AAE1Y8H0_9LAMI|nr:putative disease resistance protein [Sesamum alatum]